MVHLKHGPYDVIILQGGVEEIPLSILNQLKNGGRIGAIFIEEGLGTARIGYKLNNNSNLEIFVQRCCSYS